MAKSSRNHDRAAGQTAISLSLPADLLAEIDELALADNRRRSNWIVTELLKAVAKKKAEKQIALSIKKDSAGDATPITHDFRLNETPAEPAPISRSVKPSDTSKKRSSKS